MEDVPEAYDEIMEARAFLQREYNVCDEDITTLADAKLSQCSIAYLKLMKELKETQKNYLVIHVFVGHAVRPNHETFYLTNSFDADTGFYELFNAEHMIKQIATDNPYSYHISVFAGRLK